MPQPTVPSCCASCPSPSRGFRGLRERKLARQQRLNIDPPRSDVLDRPVEFDAPAERALEVELLGHDLADDERQRLVRQSADLDDGASALDCRDAALERSETAGRLESDVELR